MRTTLDLPPELLRAAKVVAAERGQTLKELFTDALAREVEIPRQRDRRRVRLPLFGGDGRTVDVTNDDIQEALDADDIERYR